MFVETGGQIDFFARPPICTDKLLVRGNVLGFVAPLLHGPPYVISADGAVGFTLDAGKAQLAAVTYKIVPHL